MSYTINNNEYITGRMAGGDNTGTTIPPVSHQCLISNTTTEAGIKAIRQVNTVNANEHQLVRHEWTHQYGEYG